MPDFTRPSDDEMTNAEAEEAKVEEEALVALSTMKIDGTGPTEEGKETWRTAQWNESSDITMSSESSCKSPSADRLLRLLSRDGVVIS